MKFRLIFLLLLSHPFISADEKSDYFLHKPKCTSCSSSQIGTVAFSGNPATWYTIDTLQYPATTLFSINQNASSTQGNVHLTPTGLKICCPGNYWISFTALFANFLYTTQIPIISVYVVRNGVFDPSTPLFSVSSLQPNLILGIQGSGVLENVASGTTISLVATNSIIPSINGGIAEPQTITVVGWGIQISKIQVN